MAYKRQVDRLPVIPADATEINAIFRNFDPETT